MSLQTYRGTGCEDRAGGDLDEDDVRCVTSGCRGSVLGPGTIVTHRGWKDSLGVVVASGELWVTVLWSKAPGVRNFTFPVVKRVQHVPLFAKQLVSVQPMTVPAGNVFFIDYAYGVSGSQGTSGSK